MQGKMRAIPREEVVAIVAFALICAFFGALTGWTVRGISNRDSLIISQIEKNNSASHYYQAEINKIMREGAKR